MVFDGDDPVSLGKITYYGLGDVIVNDLTDRKTSHFDVICCDRCALELAIGERCDEARQGNTFIMIDDRTSAIKLRRWRVWIGWNLHPKIPGLEA